MPTIHFRLPARPSSAGLAIAALLLMLWAPAVARADWTTYRGDAARSGIDTSSVGSVPFASAWSSPNLGGDIWGQPLVHNGLVIAATETNQVWALSESTGQVVWQASAGPPVPASGPGPHPPCGDISPWVGITSTPVIDPASNEVFVVADNLISGTIVHQLYAFNLANGSAVTGFPVSVEPPGDTPSDQLQRPGLALAGGQVIVGYGGNDGDCGSYHGWLVSVPETGGPMRSFEVDQSGSQGAIWGAGNAPPVDSTGDVWVSTGNGNSSSTFEYQESVLKLDPSMNLLDHWAPSDWQMLDQTDADIGSSAPVLLPGGRVFEIGKQGIGYELSAASLGGTGAAPLAQPSVCSGSWGGAIYNAGAIYVTCSNGLHALSYDASTGAVGALNGWTVPAAANGPPTIAGGLVWATDWTHGVLYGLNPQTGQPVVNQPTPGMKHFSTPSASDGKLFLATGPTVEAYTIANPASTPGTTPVPILAPAAGSCTLRMRSNRVKIHHPRKARHAKHAPPAYGTVSLTAKCTQNMSVILHGLVTERPGTKSKHTFHLASVHANLTADVARTLQIRLGPSLLRALERRVHESGAFTLNAGGATPATTHGRLRL